MVKHVCDHCQILLFSGVYSPLPCKRILHPCQSPCDPQCLLSARQTSLALQPLGSACGMFWPMEYELPSRSSKMPWKFPPAFLLSYLLQEQHVLGEGCSFSLSPGMSRHVDQSHDDLQLVTCIIKNRSLLYCKLLKFKGCLLLQQHQLIQ